MSLDEFYFSFVFCGIWKQRKLNKKTPSEQVEIKEISTPHLSIFILHILVA